MGIHEEKRDQFWPVASEKFGLDILGYPKVVRVTQAIADLLESERPPHVAKGEHLITEAINSLLLKKYMRNVRDFHSTVVALYGLDLTSVKSAGRHGDAA